MFNSIRGKLTEKLADSVHIETGGVEWNITVPATDIGRLPQIGSEGRIFTWLSHREDQMKLFGFFDEQRRNTFLELLKVEGIGPKAAIKIMGGIAQDDLERALETEDLARLEAIPGLGKKTAQKMILALKGKLTFSNPLAAQASGPWAELVEALAGMGYDRKQAAEALAKAEKGLEKDLSGEEKEKRLFREAIVYLSGQ
jgi:Holliday junction DNA helicase RuvA